MGPLGSAGQRSNRRCHRHRLRHIAINPTFPPTRHPTRFASLSFSFILYFFRSSHVKCTPYTTWAQRNSISTSPLLPLLFFVDGRMGSVAIPPLSPSFLLVCPTNSHRIHTHTAHNHLLIVVFLLRAVVTNIVPSRPRRRPPCGIVFPLEHFNPGDDAAAGEEVMGVRG